MGGSYFVPRSVKGESRILYIFSVKSFIVTLIFALVGVVVYLLLNTVINISIVMAIIIVATFGAIGYVITTVTIPDTPMMGNLRKAGGENLGNMIIRLLMFKKKKKIYLYSYKRKVQGGTEK